MFVSVLAALSRYKLAFEILAALALIAGISFGIHRFLQHEQQIGYDRAVSEYKAKLLEATQAAREKEAALTKQLKDANDALARAQDTIRALSAANVAASNGLRDTANNISKRLSSFSADALRLIARTYGDIFTECQSRYGQLAEKTERINAEKRALMDAWPKEGK